MSRQQVHDGTATAKALDYSLRRWVPLTRLLSDGHRPIDNNNRIANKIRPIAIGRTNGCLPGHCVRENVVLR